MFNNILYISDKWSNWVTVVNCKMEEIHQYILGLLFCFSIPKETFGNTDEKVER